MIESWWRRPVRATIGLERLCEGPEGRDDEARLVAATPVSEHPRERGERLQITFRSIWATGVRGTFVLPPLRLIVA